MYLPDGGTAGPIAPTSLLRRRIRVKARIPCQVTVVFNSVTSTSQSFKSCRVNGFQRRRHQITLLELRLVYAQAPPGLRLAVHRISAD